MSSDAGSFQAEWNKCRTLYLKHSYKLNSSGQILSDDSNFCMIGEVFEVAILGFVPIGGLHARLKLHTHK